ncbi:hypothetical protein JZ751_013994, partial [Albula glossodonta]
MAFFQAVGSSYHLSITWAVHYNVRAKHRMPVTIKNRLESQTVQEEEQVELVVELSEPSLEVKWMKNNVELHLGNGVELHSRGAEHSLLIKRVSYADRGYYSCQTPDDKTQAKLTVKMRKIQVVKGLKEVKTCEKEMALFQVELSHDSEEGWWTKDGNMLKPGPRCHITALGKMRTLTLCDLTVEDAGMIAFHTDEVYTSARLTLT